ncbi:MAG TPA: DUF5995 family protein [Mucilaginibacter sp.]|nr:DUF5995 family protein [Mucilaginibacter sp.]
MQINPAKTLDDVIAALEGIIAESIDGKSRLGYFAALYLKVTNAVKEGIASGQFSDGKQLAELDVVFANRYLDAYHQWKNKQPTSNSWMVAFQQTESSQVLVLQHLLLGMNAHINFDLGIAAVEVCGDRPMTVLKADFNAINLIIASLTNQVLNELGQVSPLLSLLGLHASNSNFALIQFSIDNARDGAWCFAEDLSLKKGANRDQFIAQRDETIKKLALSLVQTKGFVRFTIWLIHLFETGNIRKVIGILNDYKKRKIVINQ